MDDYFLFNSLTHGSVLWVQLGWTECSCWKLCFEVKHIVKIYNNNPLSVFYVVKGCINLCCLNCIILHVTPTHLWWINYICGLRRMVTELVNSEAKHFHPSHIALSVSENAVVGVLISLMWWLSVHCLVFFNSKKILLFMCLWIEKVMALNDTIKSCMSHYCFRVIVFPRISSRSAHCIIIPSNHGDKFCTQMFPVQTLLKRKNAAYFTELFRLTFQSLTILSWLYASDIDIDIYVLDISCIVVSVLDPT